LAKVDGTAIRCARKKRNMTQEDLADGICKQGTISNLEQKNISNNIEILQAICDRLDLKLETVLVKTDKAQLEAKLTEVEQLCFVSKNKEAKQMLDAIDIDSIKDLSLRTKAKYYYAMLEYLVKGKDGAPLFYFNEILNTTEPHDLYNILANNGLGIVFEGKKDFSFAKKYYDQSLSASRELSNIPLRLVKIFYNAARFYSTIEDYNKAIDLCHEGISINKKYQSTFQLEYLLYEKAFNFYKANHSDYKTLYADAKKIAHFNHNEYVSKIIDSDLEKLDLKIL